MSIEYKLINYLYGLFLGEGLKLYEAEFLSVEFKVAL